jgi:thiosulfate dehydrogenase
VPIGSKVEGQGMFPITIPNRAANLVAGEKVFQTKCTECHSPDGQGKHIGIPGDGKGYAFPPLWGPDSFNDGAGMSRLLNAAAFIKANMPLGVPNTQPGLSDEDAFDVAAYVLSKPRPARSNLEADFPARWNKPVDAAYPPYVDGASAEQHKYGPFQELAGKMKELRKAKGM